MAITSAILLNMTVSPIKDRLVCLSVLLSIAKAIIGDGMLRFHYCNNVIKRSESSQYGDAAILKGGMPFQKIFLRPWQFFLCSERST